MSHKNTTCSKSVSNTVNIKNERQDYAAQQEISSFGSYQQVFQQFQKQMQIMNNPAVPQQCMNNQQYNVVQKAPVISISAVKTAPLNHCTDYNIKITVPQTHVYTKKIMNLPSTVKAEIHNQQASGKPSVIVGASQTMIGAPLNRNGIPPRPFKMEQSQSHFIPAAPQRIQQPKQYIVNPTQVTKPYSSIDKVQNNTEILPVKYQVHIKGNVQHIVPCNPSKQLPIVKTEAPKNNVVIPPRQPAAAVKRIISVVPKKISNMKRVAVTPESPKHDLVEESIERLQPSINGLDPVAESTSKIYDPDRKPMKNILKRNPFNKIDQTTLNKIHDELHLVLNPVKRLKMQSKTLLALPTELKLNTPVLQYSDKQYLEDNNSFSDDEYLEAYNENVKLYPCKDLTPLSTPENKSRRKVKNPKSDIKNKLLKQTPSKTYFDNTMMNKYLKDSAIEIKRLKNVKKGCIRAEKNKSNSGKVNYMVDRDNVDECSDTHLSCLQDLCHYERNILTETALKGLNSDYDEDDKDLNIILYEEIDAVTPCMESVRAKPYRLVTEVNDFDCDKSISDNSSIGNTSEKSIVTDLTKYQRIVPITINLEPENITQFSLINKEIHFLQNAYCAEYSNADIYCRECIKYDSLNKSCRFINFRKLCQTKNQIESNYEFIYPQDENTNKADLYLWTYSHKSLLENLDDMSSKFLLSNSLNTFCNILKLEKEAYVSYKNNSIRHAGKICYKSHVRGIRELCDVCYTTIFNYHWICEKCGYAVCIDCYKNQTSKNENVFYDKFNWTPCTDNCKHYHTQLMFTQIIPLNCLDELQKKVHEVCATFMPELTCDCDYEMKSNLKKAQMSVEKPKPNIIRMNPFLTQTILSVPKNKILKDPELASTILNVNANTFNKTITFDETFLQIGKESSTVLINRESSININSILSTTQLYPSVKHEWLCRGKLLRLTDSSNDCNYSIFQDHWIRGQPAIVSNLTSKLNSDLWHPLSFSRDFGHIRNDLFNCLSGNIVPNQLMSTFWDGFEDLSKRLRNSSSRPMLLKLKDWPHGDDFAEVMPTRFQDLMDNLPLGEYTRRKGKLNLASRLPDAFVRPDLGPKMYNAYGSVNQLQKGTTNLHLDISDAVNIMIYVGVPEEYKTTEYNNKIVKALLDADCDKGSINNIMGKKLPGAVWHIYDPKDTVRIRDLLNKLKIERGERIAPGTDCIHDQNFYLDKKLRFRLFKEYGVVGYSIIQCLGDAIFIPAGAPHQVRNLYNCIKVAEDFVSSENVGQCYFLTQEFRKLSVKHANREDKLQIKNIVYHSVKDAVNFLTQSNITDELIQ